MRELKERFIVNERGERVGVVLDVRAYDSAKGSGDEVTPFEQAIREIEQKRG